MDNFDFLKPVDNDLYEIIHDAEKLYKDEYFEQYIFDSSTKKFTMIGTTKNTGMNNVKFYQNDTDYYNLSFLQFSPQ